MCFQRQRIPKHLLLQPTFSAHPPSRWRMRWILPRVLALLVGIAAIYYANAHAYSGAASSGLTDECRNEASPEPSIFRHKSD